MSPHSRLLLLVTTFWMLSSMSLAAALTAEQVAWRKTMGQKTSNQAGCLTAEFPKTEWQSVPCGSPKTAEKAVKEKGIRPLNVGNTTDFYVQVPQGKVMASVTGGFTQISGVTTESGNTESNGVADPGQLNTFTLQMNTVITTNADGSISGFPTTVPGATFSGTNPCTANPNPCTGFQQFVYASSGTSGGTLEIFYFLFNAGKCPTSSVFSPGTAPVPWGGSGNECAIVTPYSLEAKIPPLTIAELGTVELTGSSDGQHDSVTLAVGTTLYKVTETNILGLNQVWRQAEFNIFGPGGGPLSIATFNRGSTMTVVDTVTGSGLGLLAASCGSGSFTAEQNGLSLSCPCTAVANKIYFTESNATDPFCQCPSGTELNANGTKCGPVVCPHEFWNPITKVCRCPLPDSHWNPTNGACIVCHPPNQWDATTFRCVPGNVCPITCLHGCAVPLILPGGQPLWRCLP